jgi:uncharacterized protein with GYD domain
MHHTYAPGITGLSSWDRFWPIVRTEELMATYLYEVSYNAEGWAKQLANPGNRIEAVRPVIEAAGGTIVAAYYAFGDADIILIADLPDNVAGASIPLAFSAGGALSSVKTTVLMSIEDGISAIAKAGTLAGVYAPPA